MSHIGDVHVVSREDHKLGHALNMQVVAGPLVANLLCSMHELTQEINSVRDFRASHITLMSFLIRQL